MKAINKQLNVGQFNRWLLVQHYLASTDAEQVEKGLNMLASVSDVNPKEISDALSIKRALLP